MTAKKGRKAGGHNKPKPIIGNPEASRFNDPADLPEYQCGKCSETQLFKFDFCPKCGSKNTWD
jgi:uncharacterized OB-fold protein